MVRFSGAGTILPILSFPRSELPVITDFLSKHYRSFPPSSYIFILRTLVSCLLVVCPGVIAEPAQKFPSDQEISARLEKSNVLGTHCEFRAKMNVKDELLDVMTPMVKGATEKDHKINAVLVGKEAMQICGNKLAKVRVIFRGLDGSTAGALIRSGDVKAFGSRLESEDELLKSIDLVRRDAMPVAPEMGPPNNKRGLIVGLKIARLRIFGLSKKGVGTTVFDELADSVKKSLGAGDLEEAAKQLNELNHHLHDQEETSRALHR
jgi:hypothetical protein